MKLELEIQGIEIKIEEIDGNIVIKAEQNGDVIDEMEVPITADEPNNDDENTSDGNADELPIPEPESEDNLPSEELEESIKSFEEFFKGK